jgi:hypothetical protein
MDLRGRVFGAINFPGSWADGWLTAWFLRHPKEKMALTKFESIKGSPKVGMHLEYQNQ